MRPQATKYLLISAVVLIALIGVPVAVVDKARRASENSTKHDLQFYYDGFHFDRKRIIIFEYKGKMKLNITGGNKDEDVWVQWSLYPWELLEWEFF